MDKVMDDSELENVAGGTKAEFYELMYFYEDQGHDCREKARNWVDVANGIRDLLAKDLGVEWDKSIPVSRNTRTTAWNPFSLRRRRTSC
ncbi:MAG: hypothetical protein IJU05_06450 [Schwartzia sp.]|nr:hypothetical protein [Schwartzia sp. (in: firmicutes)]